MNDKELIERLRYCGADCDMDICGRCPDYEKVNCMEELLIAAADRISGLLTELRKLKNQTRWIQVTEKLPDNNNPVLVYCTNTTIGGGNITHIGSFNSGRYWFLRAEPGIATFPVREWQVTHWMSLPEPPEKTV